MLFEELPFAAEIYSESECSRRCSSQYPVSGGLEAPDWRTSVPCRIGSSGLAERRRASSIISIRPSDFRNEITTTRTVRVPLPKRKDAHIRTRQAVSGASEFSPSEEGQGNAVATLGEEFQLEIPACTFESLRDPTVFYRVPVGFGLWEGAHALMAQIWETGGDLTTIYPSGSTNLPMSIHNKRVMELGCGVAPLPALATAALGARYVVCTDYISEIVNMAQENLNLNFPNCQEEKARFSLGLSETEETREDHGAPVDGRRRSLIAPGATGDGSTNTQNDLDEAIVKAEYLSWGEEIPDHIFENSDSQNTFDILLGADICYSVHEVSELLKETMDRLTHKGSLLILSHTHRQREEEEKFVNELLSDKFRVVRKWEEDQEVRWERYGKVAHNVKNQNNGALVFVVLEKISD